jgi:hypothetical protein
MLLKQFNADGTAQRIEVQTNVSCLHFTIATKHTKADTDAARTTGLPVESFLVKAVLDKLFGLVSVSRYSNSGTKALVNNIPLSALMECNAFGRSVISHKTASTDGAFTYVETTFLLALSNLGSIKADKTNFIVLEYTNPASTGLISFTVDAVSSYISYESFIGIDTLTTQDNQTTNFDCTEAYLLIIPSATAKVRIDSKAGDTLELSRRELGNIQLMTTDEIHNCDGRVLKSVYWDAVDVGQAYRGELLTDVKSNFYLLSNKGY